MKTHVLTALLVAVLYTLCWYAVGPSTHVPGLDGPVSQCRNEYHTHQK